MNTATSSQSSKKRGLGPDRNTAACKEVEELTKAGILQEVKHHTWVANPVMVKKSNGGWRMCVDFTYINKACPKDCYPLPEIDWKNAGATYQRLVDKVFHDQIGRNLEAYVDDMVIKSTSEEEMLADIKETFKKFLSINMKLNPKKCSFGVEEGPFLGHLITKQGIRANPSKTLTKPKKLGRVAKWAIELGEHDIAFQERVDKTPKDFLIEVPIEDNEKKAEEKKTKKALKGFDSYTIEHIRRNQNKKADTLSKLALMTFEHLTKEVLVEVLLKRSIEEKEILQVETKEGESWMTPIHEYLVSGLLPKDPKESSKIKVKAPQYKLIRGNLYRRSFYSMWLRCVASPQTDDIVKEVREGWVDDLAQVLWVHRMLPRNSQKETPFSLTYGSEAIIPIPENDVAKDDRGRIKRHTGMAGSSHDKRSSRRGTSQNCRYIRPLIDSNNKEYEPSLEDIMRQVTTLHLKTDKQVKDLRLHMRLHLIKRIKESDLKSSKSSNMMGDYAPHGSLPPSMTYDIFL
ncbi:reverse transcriptase domain-containing protein [Tanacetum coccineum]